MKKHNRKSKKETSGITLIALVVTIVILLILAGVSINLVLGPNGLITRAQEAAQKTNNAIAEEEELLNSIANEIDNWVGGIEKPTINIPVTDYGAVVTGYKCPNSSAVPTWRIFYSGDADGDGTSNVYLIADEYIATPPNSKNNHALTRYSNSIRSWYWNSNVLSDYNNGTTWINGQTGGEDNSLAKGLLRNWTESSYSNQNYANMKAVAYMMDTNVWSVYAGEDAEYAIGGPTLELFIESYNKTHPTKKIQSQIANANGYQVKWETDGSFSYGISGLPQNDTNSIYIKSSTSYANGMWLASPSAHLSDYLMSAGYNGDLGNYGCANYNSYNSGLGSRPLVCLNSDIQMERQEDGSYMIK